MIFLASRFVYFVKCMKSLNVWSLKIIKLHWQLTYNVRGHSHFDIWQTGLTFGAEIRTIYLFPQFVALHKKTKHTALCSVQPWTGPRPTPRCRCLEWRCPSTGCGGSTPSSTAATPAYSPSTASAGTRTARSSSGEVKTAIYRTVKVLCSYLPGKVSPITIHNLPGINVELSKSSMNYVTLSPLSLDSTGRYRCEVSEEVRSSHRHRSHVTSRHTVQGPMFATDSAYGDLLVVVVPEEGPKLVGARSRWAEQPWLSALTQTL